VVLIVSESLLRTFPIQLCSQVSAFLPVVGLFITEVKRIVTYYHLLKCLIVKWFCSLHVLVSCRIPDVRFWARFSVILFYLLVTVCYSEVLYSEVHYCKKFSSDRLGLVLGLDSDFVIGIANFGIVSRNFVCLPE